MLISIIWSCLSLASPENLKNYGNSIALCFENIGLMIFPFIIGKIYDDEK